MQVSALSAGSWWRGAVVQDGVQSIRSELGYGGYPVITVRAGIHVEWTIHAEEDRVNSCNHDLRELKERQPFPLSLLSRKAHFRTSRRLSFNSNSVRQLPDVCFWGHTDLRSPPIRGSWIIWRGLLYDRP